MLLTISERLMLMDILPQTGDYASLKTITKARLNLSFSALEIKNFGIRQVTENGVPQVTWDREKETEVDVPVDEYTISVIKQTLIGLNEKHELNVNLLTLFEKFVIDYETTA